MGDARGFLVLCDKNLENQVGDIVSKLSDGSGEIIIKTIEDVTSPTTRGSNFTKKFENLLGWAHGVVLVSSSNFTAFIDKKKKDNLPAILKDNHKASHTVLEKFIKTHPNKLLSISVNGEKSLPKSISGKIEILEQEQGQEHIFIANLKGMIAGKMNED